MSRLCPFPLCFVRISSFIPCFLYLVYGAFSLHFNRICGFICKSFHHNMFNLRPTVLSSRRASYLSFMAPFHYVMLGFIG
ncbi:hypothetical protein BDV93DRAFT_84106 [Ceratobasidium sp. AG-I]|nr:hypothetical protein BDV93DRAFT_84106 [Ceratobasidium sp. AG-I]